MKIFFLLLLAVGAAGAASGCSTNADCELLGTCTAGKCLCSKVSLFAHYLTKKTPNFKQLTPSLLCCTRQGFTGETCGRLDLLPADSATANGNVPLFHLLFSCSSQLYVKPVDIMRLTSIYPPSKPLLSSIAHWFCTTTHHAGKAWPKQPSGTGAAAWGMSVVRGDHDNYHAIVNVRICTSSSDKLLMNRPARRGMR